MACSCTAGKAPAAANDGDRTAMRSPLQALGGWTRSCAMRVIEAQRHRATHLGFPPPGRPEAAALRRGEPPFGTPCSRDVADDFLPPARSGATPRAMAVPRPRAG